MNSSRDWAPWPVFGSEEIEAVGRVLKSGRANYWTGEEGRRFEREFSRAVGCRYGVALANGTVALELALEAVGIAPGDEVIVTARSFIASASAIVLRGAVPVFADVDPDSGNVTAETIAPVISSRTRAVLVVHLAGWPVDIDPIRELADQRGLKIIEDAAQAHGARYHERPVGSLGDVAAFSFCQDKIMSTGGEGGMLVTDDEATWRRAWSYKDHGKDHDAAHAPAAGSVFRWLHAGFGTNWRMTEMQSAIGRVVLPRLPDWLAARRQNAAVLAGRLKEHPLLVVPEPPPGFFHAWYKFYAFLDPRRLTGDWSRDRVVAELVARGIPAGSGVCPEIYREAAFAGTDWAPRSRLPVARRLGETSLMFCVHPGLRTRHMHRTADVLETVLARASRRAA